MPKLPHSPVNTGHGRQCIIAIDNEQDFLRSSILALLLIIALLLGDRGFIENIDVHHNVPRRTTEGSVKPEGLWDMVSVVDRKKYACEIIMRVGLPRWSAFLSRTWVHLNRLAISFDTQPSLRLDAIL